ncbi:anaerobic ribonucleoside-triphosphate reductase activating protein [Elstera cyanobacteriorum]|uniref:Anaerobic ribonucleoside-triphosphate reductase activating protein n=1 Tax=Elstera cyanobacteriorum TaxID=2022747 RepID=A0A255XQL2_9PROT|nr:anaerobic ribonucleoside-triphosphate reductase activating protein [Elstera cyanobacteriorum]MCK6444708.1 anaerobic ribonucleoside-triphosphate reductase activating protein [Elstera cyanobacteriorum]OYQ19258.1 anaerobic ribonucleoside-triphosphate reductase activating protein [Elstera cyanobacteriorum]GFZ90138.1 anaerobic ribonucleoside-triphosphate reductase activating protein [Elstera cyanobacteriorum]
MLRLPVAALQPFTALDFPGRLACILFFAGCPLRCGYCHNPDIVTGRGRLSVAVIEAFLEKRRGLIDGLVLSGGEAALWPEAETLAAAAQARGYAVKLDTAGTRPDRLARLLADGRLQALALDAKAPEVRFAAVTGRAAWGRFCDSLALTVAAESLAYREIRTTIHPALLSAGDLKALRDTLAAAGWGGPWYLQEARTEGPMLVPLPSFVDFPDLDRVAVGAPFPIILRQRDGRERALTG